MVKVKSALTRIIMPWEILQEKVDAQEQRINELAERVLALERENYEQEMRDVNE